MGPVVRAGGSSFAASEAGGHMSLWHDLEMIALMADISSATSRIHCSRWQALVDLFVSFDRTCYLQAAVKP